MFKFYLAVSGLILLSLIAMSGLARADRGSLPAPDRASRLSPPALVVPAADKPEWRFDSRKFHGPTFEPRRLQAAGDRLQAFDPPTVERLPLDHGQMGWTGGTTGYGYMHPFGVPPAIRPGETAADILGAGGPALWKW